jgi:hypothetical protein
MHARPQLPSLVTVALLCTKLPLSRCAHCGCRAPQEDQFCDEFHLVDLRMFDNCKKVGALVCARGCGAACVHKHAGVLLLLLPGSLPDVLSAWGRGRHRLQHTPASLHDTLTTRVSTYVLAHRCRHHRRHDYHCHQVTAGCDHVFCLAADMGGMGFIQSNHSVILYNNTMISYNTLEAARQNGCSRCARTRVPVCA